MNKIKTKIEDCYIIEPTKIGDERGWFQETYSEKAIKELGIDFSVVQGNASKSAKGVIRGLHFQNDPMCQAKLVNCPRGSLYDIIVDLRKDSPSYGESVMVLLSEENNKRVFVPRGCAHGFIALEHNTELNYLVDNLYSKNHEGGINFNDESLEIYKELQNIIETLKKEGINVVQSPKDKEAPLLKNSDNSFYNKKRYMVIGATGQLGYDVVRELNNRKIYDVLVLGSKDLDITDQNAVTKMILDYKPEYVINCAAYTKVDNAELEEEQEKAYKINALGPKYITDACRIINAKLLHVSTDYVFKGEGNQFYDVNTHRNPQNYYGYTKCLGEEYVEEYDHSFIVRISWVFGMNGQNFIKTMLKLSEKMKEIKVVNDQIGSPTYTVDAAKFMINLINSNKYGKYNFTNEGTCSWDELARYVFAVAEKDVIVNGVPSSEYNKDKIIAARPLNSRLSKKEIYELGIQPPCWKIAVDDYLENLGYQKTIK